MQIDFFTPRGSSAFLTALYFSIVVGLIYLFIRLILKRVREERNAKRPGIRINLLNDKSRKRIKQVIKEREKEKRN